MSSSNMFLTAHHWGALLCVPIGLSLNLLLLWLILKCTPKEMWVHSRVLLQTCGIDFVQIAVLAAGGYTMVDVQPGELIVFLDGYLISFLLKLWPGQKALFSLFNLSMGIIFFDMHATSVQFIYRYLVLNHEVNIGLGRYFLLLLPCFLADLALTGMGLLITFRLPNYHNETIDNGLVDLLEQKPFYVVYGKNDLTNPWIMVSIFCNICSASIIIFCGFKMVRFVAAHAMSQRLKELNRQLSRSLIILAAFPILYMAFIFLGLIFFVLIGLSNDVILAIKLLLSPLIHWLPVLNPIVSIWTFRPYRDAIFAAACCKLKIAPVTH